MTRLRAALAAVAMAAGLLAAPAAAAPGDTFVLRGSTSGWVDVDVPGSGYAVNLLSARIQTGGRFGGFFAEQLTSTRGEQYVGATTGALVVRDLSIGAENPALLGGATHLTPGRIRFYLIADGPTTVTIDSHDDLPGRTLRPTRRSATSYAVLPLRRTGDAWSRNAGVTLPKRSTVLVGMLAHGDLLDTAEPEVCLANATADCPGNGSSDAPLRRGQLVGDGLGRDETRVWWRSYRSGGPVFPGRRHARYAITPATSSLPVRQARGVAFVLTLV